MINIFLCLGRVPYLREALSMKSGDSYVRIKFTRRPDVFHECTPHRADNVQTNFGVQTMCRQCADKLEFVCTLSAFMFQYVKVCL